MTMKSNIETITSLQNPRVKEVTALQSSSSLRRERGLFVVEGLREVTRCLESGFRLRSLFYCPAICSADTSASLKGGNIPFGQSTHTQPLLHSLPGNEGTRIFEVSENVYRKMAYREGTEGLLAVVCGNAGDRSLEALDLRLFGNSGTGCPDHEHAAEAGIPAADYSTGTPLIVVVESVEKPGNLGAMLRTADAAGVSAVLICDPRTDLYNPNLIRASLGGVFTRNIAVCSSEEAIAWLKARGISILTAQLQDSELYYDTDMTRPTALAFGAEADGLSDIWRQAADAHIRIPMLGGIDSLNVSASMAVLCYEALRQRRTSGSLRNL